MAYNTGRFQSVGGSADEPNYLYYNCDIVSNQTRDQGLAVNSLATPFALKDPQIRFNETRDTALIKDASLYEFSIIRFTMNGANRDLPLFIPNITLDQPDVNRTTYSVALSYQQSWNTNLGVVAFNITPAPRFVVWSPEVLNPVIAPIPNPPITFQDLSSRYYWATTYQHWVNLVNATILVAHQSVYDDFKIQWLATAGLTDPFPYPTFADFLAQIDTPKIVYDESSLLFTIFGDSNGFGQRLETFVPIPYVAGTASPQTQPRLRLFFNTNMAGLFANFSTLYWNRVDIPATTYDGVVYPAFPAAVPEGYVYELMFSNKFYQNVVDYRIPPYSGVPPLGYVPTALQKVYWRLTQDYKSVDSLWSPVSSIVFTTSLIPIKYEANSQPNILGDSNLGNSAPTAKSAFDPIITDIALDTAAGGASDYRKFIYYTPIAEYRISDLTPSKQELRNIDIQVFWKNRLDSQLYPLNMYNLSTVSLKLMFRKKGL
jgi:hypothetical protein